VVAGLVRGGDLVWTGGRGEVAGVEPDADTQYRIGSITKTFAAILVLQLRDAGRLRLDDPVEAHLPGCGLGPATVAQLLAHTSGLRSETGGPWWERTAGDDYAELERSTLHAEGARVSAPGRAFHYSNTGYGLVGELVARLAGAPWHEVLRKQVLTPLGMTRTSTRPQPPAAQGYAVHPWADVLLPEPEADHGAMAPAGQLWSTVTDLSRLVAVLAGDSDLLPADTLAEMTSPQGLAAGRTGPWDIAYGLGVQLWNDAGRRRHGHGGSMPGFLAMACTEAGGDGVITLTNTTAGADADLGEDLMDLLATYDPPIPGPWRPQHVEPALLALTGVWFWGPTPLALRAGPDGAVELESIGRGGRTSRFAPTGPHSWRGRDGYYAGETLTVVSGPGGGALRLELGSFVFTREPYQPDAGVSGGDVPWDE
jgi:CubicO group peptidase (beta-lactamase class C family)